ncbi:NAD(P)/FAD-dependent oxidoreductase [Anthocerotibacter panamensis]|uniref:NAD(P)/FAD-dependent oxidoreductase n=1 Tax=Anthocerotibacter panamensis TaxID=2857077 RepID=UPI001C405497|nr:FAD-dependent oxidoreductase [Anthocerotibacter panamensis]
MPVVVLAGCGYGAIACMQALKGKAQIIAISPKPYLVNSGMTPRLLSGRFTPDDPQIPLEPYFQQTGTHYLAGRVNSLDPVARVVTIQGKTQPVSYDYLVLNVGRVPDLSVPGAQEYAFSVRPVERILALRAWVQDCWQRAAARDDRAGLLTFVVAGGGYTGVELMGELHTLCQALHRTTGIPWSRVRLVLVVAGSEPAPGLNSRFSKFVAAALKRRGIAVWPASRVSRIEPTQIILQTPTGPVTLPCHTTVWATGLRVEEWLAASGLPTASDGSVLVDRYLRVSKEERILALGDCACFEANPALPKLGVYAVRAAPIVAQNLVQIMQGGQLTPFQPQGTVFVSVTTGAREAVMHKGWITHQGRVALKLKNLFDYLYMRRHKPVDWRKYLC